MRYTEPVAKFSDARPITFLSMEIDYGFHGLILRLDGLLLPSHSKTLPPNF